MATIRRSATAGWPISWARTAAWRCRSIGMHPRGQFGTRRFDRRLDLLAFFKPRHFLGGDISLADIDVAAIAYVDMTRPPLGAAADALFGKKVSRLSAIRYHVKIDAVALDDTETSEMALNQCP